MNYITAVNVYPFPFFLAFIVFAIVIFFLMKRGSGKYEKEMEDYFKREKEADLTPAKDISSLPYITIPIGSFPIGKFTEDDDEESLSIIEDKIKVLNERPLLNLSGKTNTDLKLEYGAPNLEKMQKIADDFDEMEITLLDYSKALMEKGHYKEAVPVLEFLVNEGSGMKTAKDLLSECKAKGN